MSRQFTETDPPSRRLYTYGKKKTFRGMNISGDRLFPMGKKQLSPLIIENNKQTTKQIKCFHARMGVTSQFWKSITFWLGAQRNATYRSAFISFFFFTFKQKQKSLQILFLQTNHSYAPHAQNAHTPCRTLSSKLLLPGWWIKCELLWNYLSPPGGCAQERGRCVWLAGRL